MEQFGLERTFKDHLVQPLCNEQGHLRLDQVALSPLQDLPLLHVCESKKGRSTCPGELPSLGIVEV